MNFVKHKIPANIYIYILTIYLVSSVVNWLPIVNVETIRVLKYILFLLLFFYEINFQTLKFPSLFLSPIGLLLIIFSMSFGMILSPDINALVDVILPFIIIWMFNFNKEIYYKVIFRSSIIIAFICLLSIGSNYTGILDIEANGPWSSTFGQAAFTGYRTGYSNSLFLFVPFLVFWHRKEVKGFFSIETFAIFIIIIAQYNSGGRAGLIASLLVFFIGYRFSIIYKVILVYAIILFSQSDEFLMQMRVVNPYGEELDGDRISSGRISLLETYFTKFLENPYFGYGFGEKSEINGITVHIVWLKNLINGGLVYVLFLLGVFFSVFNEIIKNKNGLSKDELKLFYSIFFISFIITFLEPNYLIGSVQGEFVYWLIISLLMKKSSENSITEKLSYEN